MKTGFSSTIAMLSCAITAIVCLHDSNAFALPPSPFVADPTDLVDPAAVYNNYNTPFPLLNIRLKAVQGDPVTIDIVNTDIDPNDSFVPEMKVHFQAGDYPDDELTDNAKLRMRGSSSRLGAQKSYRVKLNTGIPLWRGETTLQLNKHPWDLARVRNKLAFDFFCDIPHINSLRTQFVHMTFDDDADPATPDVDYGLYTHVEKMGPEYLAKRGWPASSNMYKAEDFTFRYDPRLALKADNSPVNKDDFELVLSIDNGKNHSTLLQMIAAIEDDGNDFATQFTRYFNRNNYLTWLAANILMGNHDTRTQNFALLQYTTPGTTDPKFYLLPWDYDGAFGFERQPDQAAVGTLYADWQLGISNYWGIPLHQRFLLQPGNLAAVEAAVEELRSLYLGKDKIQAKIDVYKPLVEYLITHDPDLANLQTVAQGVEARRAEWANEYQRFVNTVEDNYNNFRQRLEKPMPFWQAANPVAGKLLLTWDASVDLQGDTVTYEVSIASQPDFADSSILRHALGVTGTSLEVAPLPNGTYYMKVVASDSKGNTQQAYDRTDENGGVYFGVYRFSLTANGSCGASQGLSFVEPPVNGLCATGTPSAVGTATAGVWNWICDGDNSWSAASCSATQAFWLTAAFAGTGGGSFSGTLSCSIGGTCSPLQIDYNTAVSLTPLPDGISRFAGWNGACGNLQGDCKFTMDGSKSVTAIFNAAPKAKIGAEFPTFPDAYINFNPVTDSVIKLLQGVQNGDFICDRNISVTLMGGYEPFFQSRVADTTIAGKLVIGSGSVVVNGIQIR